MNEGFSIPGTILLTGGTGTFGHAFVYETLTNYPNTKIRIFSRDEFKQSEMRKLYPQDDRLTYILGDVRDRGKVDRAIWNVDAVVHAAALKQVPALEENPLEAMKTNVQGTANVMEAAIDAGVRVGVMISTDKACRPINTYGMSKALAERIWRGAGAYMGGRGKDRAFVVCRFGNVVGSRGSVVGLWRKQIAAKTQITVTNGHMTRFLMTPLDAVQFVWGMMTQEQVEPGALYVPKPVSTRVNSLLTAVIESEVNSKLAGAHRTWFAEERIEFIGFRPGEKFHEELLSPTELALSTDQGSYFEVPIESEGTAVNRAIGSAGYVGDEGYDSSQNRMFAKDVQELVERAQVEEKLIWKEQER